MPKNLAPNYDTKENQHVRCHWETKGDGGCWFWVFLLIGVFFLGGGRVLRKAKES